jgi:hypothetical protein
VNVVNLHHNALPLSPVLVGYVSTPSRLALIVDRITMSCDAVDDDEDD